jgi:FtsP/CotA-like multicopper oxidase with cupredoxin domain
MSRQDRNLRDDRPSLRMSRRSLLKSGMASVAAASVLARTRSGRGEVPPAPTSPPSYVPRPFAVQYRFRVGATTLNPDGKAAVPGVTVNGQYPAPEIRAREGTTLRVQVENGLEDSPTAIHWHGLLLPAAMDGVPDISNFPIASRRVFLYEYPLLQSGTYWYHSHWQFQEQVGFAGPLVIEPKDEPLRVDHDAVVMLADWLHRSPDEVFAELRKAPASGKPAVTGMQMQPGMGMKMQAPTDATTRPTMGMRPSPSTTVQGQTGMDMTAQPGAPAAADLSDVRYDAFLLNGRGTQDPWTLAARPGARVRLRLINGGASTYFRVRLDGHPLQVTHADGLAVEPVTVDHILMGMAEVYDVLVALSASGSYTLHAVAQDGSGQAIGVLHTPDVTPKPNLETPAFDGRALAYTDLRAVAPTTLPEGPVRPFTLALQGDMKTYTWMINAQAYPKADPLLIRQGDRVQIEMPNQTMMWHPMHLHGHFFRVLQGAGERAPLKHTVNVPPRETVRIEFTADNPGQWFFHCHNLYHLEAGMARVFQYEA